MLILPKEMLIISFSDLNKNIYPSASSKFNFEVFYLSRFCVKQQKLVDKRCILGYN